MSQTPPGRDARTDGGALPSRGARLGWFVALWIGGVVTLGVVASGLRWLLAP